MIILELINKSEIAVSYKKMMNLYWIGLYCIVLELSRQFSRILLCLKNEVRCSGISGTVSMNPAVAEVLTVA